MKKSIKTLLMAAALVALPLASSNDIKHNKSLSLLKA